MLDRGRPPYPGEAVAIQMNNGLAAMLSKILGKPGGEGKTEVHGHGLKEAPAEAPGAKKGTPLGDGTVVHGAGYNPRDKTTPQKNVHEAENLQRFLKDPELPKKEEAANKPSDDRDAKAARDAERAEAKEVREAQRAEVRKDERAEDVKAHQLRDTKQEEAREERGHHEHDRHKDDKDKDDERQRHGQPYVPEDLESAEESPRGKYDRDALGDAARCRGTLEDGERCLRKPVAGTSYCREHYAGKLDPGPEGVGGV